MRYNILNPDLDKPLLERLLRVRNIDISHADFLDPRFWHTWHSPLLLSDMQKAVSRIILAMRKQENIVIFADYDVDGVVSSYLLLHFLTERLKYKRVTIMYPDRMKDWYGLKSNHVEDMKKQWTNLVITVDNWITSVQEVALSQELGMDVIVTDHHHSTWELPPAFAIVNPHTSEDYPFKWICGAAVAFKVLCHLMETSTRTTSKKKKLFQYYLPFVSIATVADCVPLVDENRVMVKQWIDLINNARHELPSSLKWFLLFCKIKEFEAFHIWFVIGPRINAWWRIASPHDSLKTLLHEWELQLHYLQQLDAINNERKRLQDEAYLLAEELIDTTKPVLIVVHESFHEGIVWIVAWRLTEKYHKPSVVLTKKEDWTLTGSLRGPSYFHVVDMLNQAKDYLLRYWWHKQAWWLSVTEDELENIKRIFLDYAERTIKKDDLIKVINVDTYLSSAERNYTTLWNIKRCAPFWMWNLEPVFALKDVIVTWKVIIKEKHTKLTVSYGGISLQAFFRRQVLEDVPEMTTLIWTVKADTYRWWYQIEGVGLMNEDNEKSLA